MIELQLGQIFAIQYAGSLVHTAKRLAPNHAPIRVHRSSSSGSLAIFAAIRRASSRVINLVRRSPAGFIFEVDIGERVPVGVADDVAPLPGELRVRLFDRPGRREAAGFCHDAR